MVFIGKILLIRYTINQCSIVCCPIQCNFYCSVSHSCDICLCVYNKMGKVGESVYINKTIEIDIYV